MAFTNYGEIRYEICKSCEQYNNIVKTCKLCGCFMPAKVEFKNAICPHNPPKWVEVKESNYTPPTENCCGQ